MFLRSGETSGEVPASPSLESQPLAKGNRQFMSYSRFASTNEYAERPIKIWQFQNS